MNNSITKKIGDCEVIIEFNNDCEMPMDTILWLIIESFKERVKPPVNISMSSQNEGIDLIG